MSRCKFGNCQHMDDEGCAVKEGWPRHAWYAQLRVELEQAAAVAKERATSKKQREGNVKYKSHRGTRSREVLLNPKKHRNVSRRQVLFGARPLCRRAWVTSTDCDSASSCRASKA